MTIQEFIIEVLRKHPDIDAIECLEDGTTIAIAKDGEDYFLTVEQA